MDKNNSSTEKNQSKKIVLNTTGNFGHDICITVKMCADWAFKGNDLKRIKFEDAFEIKSLFMRAFLLILAEPESQVLMEEIEPKIKKVSEKEILGIITSQLNLLIPWRGVLDEKWLMRMPELERLYFFKIIGESYREPIVSAWFAGWELEARICRNLNSSDYNINEATAIIFYWLSKNDPNDPEETKKLAREQVKILAQWERALGQPPGSIKASLWKSLEEDVSKIKISKIHPADETRIGEIFYEKLNNMCEKEFSGLSGKELEMVGFESNRKFNYLPNAVWHEAVNRLTPASEIKNIRKRLRKAGKTDKEIKNIIKNDPNVQRYYNLQRPISILLTEQTEDSENYIHEQYVSVPDEIQKLNYIQTKETVETVIIKLKKCKETVFKNSGAGRAYIDYVLNNRDNDELKFTNREIAKATGFHEDYISIIRKRLDNELPLIRDLLS